MTELWYIGESCCWKFYIISAIFAAILKLNKYFVVIRFHSIFLSVYYNAFQSLSNIFIIVYRLVALQVILRCNQFYIFFSVFIYIFSVMKNKMQNISLHDMNNKITKKNVPKFNYMYFILYFMSITIMFRHIC